MRITLIAAALLCTAVTSGCSEPPPPPPAAPAFVLPSAGRATDTVLRIGDPFPEIETVDLDGNPVTLNAELADGGYTLIVFWSTWCGFCMLELPHEVELARQYEPHGLRVIGINADETPAVAQAAVAEHNVPWLNLYEGPDLKISNELGINEWPVLLLLGPDGKLLCATQHLRGISVQLQPDGSTTQVTGLDWTLEQLLDNKESR
jgi:thiol-disulfide isomerase/thioredoxin